MREEKRLAGVFRKKKREKLCLFYNFLFVCVELKLI